MDIIFQVGPNFWNVRHSFKVMRGLINLGTHMSIIKLNNGRFLIIDTIPLTPEVKTGIDLLTENGTNIEAVIATHPFHTLAFPAFYMEYPNVPYFGTPRHLRIQPQIPWQGSLVDCNVRNKWLPEIEMRIPAGSEFVAPVPEKSNHFSSVFVFHPESRTIHVDDTIFNVVDPNILLRIAGFKNHTTIFHPTLKSVGLHHQPDAPYEFRNWVAGIIKDWDFDNICAAHMGNKIGGAKQALQETLDHTGPLFDKLHEKYQKNPSGPPPEEHNEGYNVEGNECG